MAGVGAGNRIREPGGGGLDIAADGTRKKASGTPDEPPTAVPTVVPPVYSW